MFTKAHLFLRTSVVAGIGLSAAAMLTLLALSLGDAGARPVVDKNVTIAPASRVVNIESPPAGLLDQTFQNVSLSPPLTTSLITVADRGGDGRRSAFVTLYVRGGGSFSSQIKEGGEDVALALVQPVRISRVSIRCDSFSDVVCQYSVSLVGS